mmetsp:Transcript_90822/g.261673  ORF Transcript_90822/g.261673 Transcript_90822/m.261673 type:complete len:202 (-) Transcript_90822:585-1190(-)
MRTSRRSVALGRPAQEAPRLQERDRGAPRATARLASPTRATTCRLKLRGPACPMWLWSLGVIGPAGAPGGASALALADRRGDTRRKVTGGPRECSSGGSSQCRPSCGGLPKPAVFGVSGHAPATPPATSAALSVGEVSNTSLIEQVASELELDVRLDPNSPTELSIEEALEATIDSDRLVWVGQLVSGDIGSDALARMRNA